MITNKNYEAYILDYYEGRLNAENTAELMLFLELHPDFKEEFKNFENVSLAGDEIKFSNKETLKKEVSELPLTEEDFIGYIESTLDASEMARIDKRIALNGHYQKELLLFKKTILVPEKIRFENKRLLKKKDKKTVPIYYYVAAAASLAAFLVLLFMVNREEKPLVYNENKQEIKNEIKNNIYTGDSILSANATRIPDISVTPVKTNVKKGEVKKMRGNTLLQKEEQLLVVQQDSSLRTLPGKIEEMIVVQNTVNEFYEEEMPDMSSRDNNKEYSSLKGYIVYKVTGHHSIKNKLTGEERMNFVFSLLNKISPKKIRSGSKYNNDELVAYSVAYKEVQYLKKK